MKQEQKFLILFVLLVSIAVLLAGCTSQSQEKPVAAPNLPTTAHAEHTTVPVSTAVPTHEETVKPASTTMEPVKQPATLSPGSETKVFDEGGISLSYPERFKSIANTSLEKMQAVSKQGGITILNIMTAPDSKDSIQVTRQDANATIEGLYREKMSISDEVAINGSVNVVSMTFVKYDVEKISLPDGTGVVKITAENSEQGTAVTYLFCKPGQVYNINFIYDSPERAESEASVRDRVLTSVHLD